MVASNHQTFVYVGLAGEGDYIGEGGIVRRADGEDDWTDISKGLPEKATSTCPSYPSRRRKNNLRRHR
ncbi:MAG: hypothetical protein CM1200mP27_08210 [Chloroflexota bacterium]|nr:MAG: hypothetical protein CM1200mP27_08210 [Chloroflexota bacterium]